jgi:WhiB family transcriptional regulator, redox-sensing transcriptional regulator
MSNQGQSYRELAALIQEHGAPCQDIPEIFFPEDFPDKGTREYAIRTAKALCAECPIRLECFAYAIENEERYGIWAGTLPHER